MEILGNQYSKTVFHDTPKEIIKFTTTYKTLNITIYHTRPNKHGVNVMLTRRNLHHFFNNKPVDILLPFKTIFYELYQCFKVKKETVLPVIWIHFETEDLSAYEIRVLHDQRYISFSKQDETFILRKLQSELTQKFKELYAKTPSEEDSTASTTLGADGSETSNSKI